MKTVHGVVERIKKGVGSLKIQQPPPYDNYRTALTRLKEKIPPSPQVWVMIYSQQILQNKLQAGGAYPYQLPQLSIGLANTCGACSHLWGHTSKYSSPSCSFCRKDQQDY